MEEVDGYHFRIDRISLTAAIPLFAINTLVMTVCPPFWATKSLTRPGEAFSTELKPEHHQSHQKIFQKIQKRWDDTEKIGGKSWF